MGDDGKGAFEQALSYIVDQDMLDKTEKLRNAINSGQEITGVQACEMIFGDYQEFVNNLFKENGF